MTVDGFGGMRRGLASGLLIPTKKTRRVFFSFHYQRDIVRVSQVRNSWVTQDRQSAGFWDAAAWEKVKRGGDAAIRRWIDSQLAGTSVTIVLISAETAGRKYILYEIRKSFELKKGLIGIRIHNLKDFHGQKDIIGLNPFDYIEIPGPFGQQKLSQICQIYDYVNDDGYNNLNTWINEAARAAGR